MNQQQLAIAQSTPETNPRKINPNQKQAQQGIESNLWNIYIYSIIQKL